MNNNSYEKINDQFLSILKNLNIDDSKQHNLNTKLDLHKKVKTIISIQTLEERKQNISKYLHNISTNNSYISLLSLYISLTCTNSTSLYSIFVNNNGPNILYDILKKSTTDKEIVLALDLVLFLINKYDMKHDIDIIIAKGIQMEKYEVFNFITDFSILFKGNCLCKMLICDILKKQNKEIDELLKKIRLSKFKNILEFLITRKIQNANKCKNHNINEILKYIETNYGNDLLINILELFCFSEDEVLKNKENLKDIEKIETLNSKDNKICINLSKKENISDCKKEQNEKLIDLNKTKDVQKIVQNEVIKNDFQQNKEIKSELKKPPIKKKMMFKKKENIVNYHNIKWTKINKENTIFSEIDIETYKKKFDEKDLILFLVKPATTNKIEIKEVKKEEIIDQKKAYALNIALSRIKADYEKIINLFLKYDGNLNNINENLVNQLLLYFPTNEEIKKILSSNSEDKFVQFFKKCHNITKIYENLNIIKMDFLIKNVNIENINKFTIFFQNIIDSKYIKDLLGSILYLGNIVNKGTSYGNAEGFNLLEINNMEVNKIKLIDYIKSKCNKVDININIVDLSYDTVCYDVNEVINIKNNLNIKHNKFDEINIIYKKMIKKSQEICNKFGIAKINDDIINQFIDLCNTN